MESSEYVDYLSKSLANVAKDQVEKLAASVFGEYTKAWKGTYRMATFMNINNDVEVVTPSNSLDSIIDGVIAKLEVQ